MFVARKVAATTAWREAVEYSGGAPATSIYFYEGVEI